LTNLQAIDNGICLHIGCGLAAPESWKNVDALTKILQKILTDRKALKDMGAAVIVRMKTWTSRESVEAHLKAIKKIMATKQRAVK